MHAMSKHSRKCKNKKSLNQDDFNLIISNQGKLNGNDKSSKSEDDRSTSDIHCMCPKDDDEFNSQYSTNGADGD